MKNRKALKEFVQFTLVATLITGTIIGCGVVTAPKKETAVQQVHVVQVYSDESDFSEADNGEAAAAAVVSEKVTAAVYKAAAENSAKKNAVKNAAKPAAKKPAATKPAAKPDATKPAATKSAVLIANEKDFENFEKLFKTLFFPECGPVDSLETDHIADVISFDFIYCCAGLYDLPEPDCYFYQDGPVTTGTDPLGKIGNSYAWMKGETVDWVLKNVLNNAPDHSYIKKRDWDDDGYDWYYKDGYYYSSVYFGPVIYEVFIESKTLNADGTYTITLNINNWNNEERPVDYTATVTAMLLDIGGQRVWKFFSGETEYIGND